MSSEEKVASSELLVAISLETAETKTISLQLETLNPKPETRNSELETLNSKPETRNSELETRNAETSTNVNPFSMASIKAKKELLESQKGIVKEEVKIKTEAFTENEMLDFWFKYAQRLNDKGLMIMSSLLRISTPQLDGFTIKYELPNEGSKIDFEKEKNELLGYLRGHLHNHNIEIEVIVNEKLKSRIAFTSQDKYNRLNEINPNLELLKKMFDLEI